MSSIYLPTLLFWENGNSWYGSLGQARFFLKPETLEGEDAPQITARLWRGPLAMEVSEILDTARFPVSQEGLEAVAAWLEAQAAKLNGE